MTDDRNNNQAKIYDRQGQIRKTMYKVIKRINPDQQCKRLILRPNGNIIINNVDQGEFALLRDSKLYVNCQNFISIPKDFEETEFTVYEGDIDGFHFLPYGKGVFKSKTERFEGFFADGFACDLCTLEKSQLSSKIKCYYSWGQKHGKYEEENNNQLIQGFFENDLKQGLFTEKQKTAGKQEYKYYKNGIMQNFDGQTYDNQQKKLSTTTRYLFNHQDYSINNFTFKGLYYGEWLNQLIVDYYLQLVIDYYKDSLAESIYHLNTIECQDIFSSQMIAKDSKPIIPPKLLEINCLISDIKKLIFIMNVDRVHFLVLVCQNQQLFLLNSQKNILQDKIILQKVVKIIPSISKAKNNSEKLKIVEVGQQHNNFDCGIHSIYNTLLQYKYCDKKVNEIDYQATKKMMEKLRIHVKNVLINDYAHLLPQISDSKQNHRY
ncbi:unnamed protein product [Paramecium octaurelia]|uniref:Ubiquitin-like protease family profile domain-containing protein n=1 Tax=Paramecium octaurelia TaxID=43137 RepID=A0A8S1WTC6_PAROT|nr:unnamed protein product [Paramecium octaurelia]